VKNLQTIAVEQNYTMEVIDKRYTPTDISIQVCHSKLPIV
jgi:hypothetical protein